MATPTGLNENFYRYSWPNSGTLYVDQEAVIYGFTLGGKKIEF